MAEQDELKSAIATVLDKCPRLTDRDRVRAILLVALELGMDLGLGWADVATELAANWMERQ